MVAQTTATVAIPRAKTKTIASRVDQPPPLLRVEAVADTAADAVMGSILPRWCYDGWWCDGNVLRIPIPAAFFGYVDLANEAASPLR